MGAVEVKGQSYFAKDIKEENTLYMMDDLECIGNETTVLDCNFAGWGVHNCRDMEVGNSALLQNIIQKKIKQIQNII